MRGMNKIVWVELLESNGVVTDVYLKTIGEAFERLGFEVNCTHDLPSHDIGKDDVCVVAVAPSVMRLKRKGVKHIVFWAQGIWPEESYMRNHNKVSYWMCGLIEKYALKEAERVFVVSNSQVRHYEKKYRLSLRDKAYVMPCSNETMHEESFFAEGKYENPVFVYAGSLAKYQCIGMTLEAFSRIQQVEPNSSLLFYTGQQDEARALVEQWNLNNVTIGYAAPNELNAILAKAKYGFVIRDDSTVNKVATPTKISSYISNGVIPVYSRSLEAFDESSEDIVRLPYRESSIVDDFLSLEKRQISPEEMLREYSEYFSSELNCRNRVEDICAFLRS